MGCILNLFFDLILILILILCFCNIMTAATIVCVVAVDRWHVSLCSSRARLLSRCWLLGYEKIDQKANSYFTLHNKAEKIYVCNKDSSFSS